MGVAISILREGATELLGLTKEDGRLSALLPADCSGLVIAESPAYATESLSIEPGPEIDLLFDLRPGDLVDGSVAWADGTPAQATVIAWPTRSPPGMLEPESLRSGASTRELLVQETDSAGVFLIPGLDPDERYTLTAMSPGGFSIDRLEWVCPPTSEAKLVLQPVFGAIVSLVDEDGGELATSEDVWQEPTGWRPLEEHVHTLPGAGRRVETAWLTGLTLTDGTRLMSRSESLLTCAGARRAPEGVMLEYSAHVPGYEALEVDFVVLPLAGTPPRYSFSLDRDRTPVGDVRVQIHGPGIGQVRSRRAGRDFGEVQLLDRQDGEQIRLFLRGSPTAPHLFEGVPAGEYDAYLELCGGQVHLGAEKLRHETMCVSPEATTELRFFLDHVGSVSFSAHGDDGRPYAGRLDLVIRSERGGALFQTFHEPPYSLGPLPPGEYEYRIDRFRGRTRREEVWGTLQIVEGRTMESFILLGDFLE